MITGGVLRFMSASIVSRRVTFVVTMKDFTCRNSLNSRILHSTVS